MHHGIWNGDILQLSETSGIELKNLADVDFGPL
jgi:hypothetical protein